MKEKTGRKIRDLEKESSNIRNSKLTKKRSAGPSEKKILKKKSQRIQPLREEPEITACGKCGGKEAGPDFRGEQFVKGAKR